MWSSHKLILVPQSSSGPHSPHKKCKLPRVLALGLGWGVTGPDPCDIAPPSSLSDPHTQLLACPPSAMSAVDPSPSPTQLSALRSHYPVDERLFVPPLPAAHSFKLLEGGHLSTLHTRHTGHPTQVYCGRQAVRLTAAVSARHGSHAYSKSPVVVLLQLYPEPCTRINSTVGVTSCT